MPPALSHSDGAQQVVIELSQALHTFGVAAHDLEESMAGTAQAVGIDAKFFVTPTSIFIAFGEAGDRRTTLLRVSPGDVNLDKLCQLYSLQSELTAESLPPIDGVKRVREIVQQPARYGWATTIPATGVATGTAASFFGGGWDEISLAGVLGVLVGSLAWLSSRHPRLRNLLPPAASLLVSLVAVSVCAVVPSVNSGIVTVSALILFIPGLTLTIAMNELATQNLVSGSARFVGAVSQLMILGFGVVLGRSLVAVFTDPVRSPATAGLGLGVISVCLLLTSIALTVLFQARPRDLPFVCVAGFLAYFSAKAGVHFLGPLAGPSLSAFALGVVSNAISRTRRQPASVLLVPGLLLLVPGSIGFQSINELLDKELLHSFESAFMTVLIAAAIVTGLLLANVMLPVGPASRKSNRHPS